MAQVTTKLKSKEIESDQIESKNLTIGTDVSSENNPKLHRGNIGELEIVKGNDTTSEGSKSPNKVQINIKSALIGTDTTLENNVKLHRSGNGEIQFVLGNDTTSEGNVSSNESKIKLPVNSVNNQNYVSGSIDSQHIAFGIGATDVSSQNIPANISTPINYTPRQESSEGADKISAQLNGLDDVLGDLGPMFESFEYGENINKGDLLKIINDSGAKVKKIIGNETLNLEKETIFNDGATTYISCCYDSTNKKIILAYQDHDNSEYGTAIVGTISGTTISFGSEVIFKSATTHSIKCCYDTTNEKVVIIYRSTISGNFGTAIIGTVSGTSISFGSEIYFKNSSTVTLSCCYDSTNSKVVIAFRDIGNSNYGTALVGTVSGTSITFGSEAVFNSGATNYIDCCYDAINGKTIISYQDVGNSGYGTAIVGTVSGTSISFGSEVTFNIGNTWEISSCYESSAGKVVLAYQDASNSDYGTAIVGTVSGTSISFGSKRIFNNAKTISLSCCYDSFNSNIVITYRDEGNTNYGTAVVAMVSETSLLFGSEIVFNEAATYDTCCYYDPFNKRIAISYSNVGNSDFGTTLVGTLWDTDLLFGSEVVFNNADSSNISCCFDSTNGKVVIVYQDGGNSDYGTAIVGTVNGTSISFGSEAVFNNASTTHISCCFDSTNGKAVIAYRDDGNSDYGTAIVGTVSGTSISFGSEVVFNSGSTRYTSSCYDSSNGKIVIAYSDAGNSSYGTAIVGTISGTSISFGSEVVFNSGGTLYTDSCYDSTNGKVVISYSDFGNSSYGTAIVGTISGTSISFGSEVVFNSAATSYISSCFDSTNEKAAIVYQDVMNSNYGTVIVGAVNGTSISFGSEIVFNNATTSYITCCYDSTNKKIVISYKDGGNSNFGTTLWGTLSGTSISFGSEIVFNGASSDYIICCYDSTNKKIVISFRDAGNSNSGTVTVGTTGKTALSFKSTFFNKGNTSDISCCYDSTNEKVIIAYQDIGNSGYGTAIVGTVSGTSISFGSEVVFNNATTYNVACCFDSTNGKAVIAYQDIGNSNYGTAIVGTVSGTSISFGSEVIFNNATTYNVACCFDSTSGKVVIAYRDAGNSHYGTAIVGTVSGTSISFGSEAVFNSGTTPFISCCYDSTNGKVIVTYQDVGNSRYGTAIVGTVSGTSISFGSEVVFNSATTDYVSGCFDSTNGKIVISYRDHGNSYYGTAIVGTVNGTSISFGSEVVFSNASTPFISCCYDSTNGKVVIAYCDAGNSNYGTTVIGTISGTSISFKSKEIFFKGYAIHSCICFHLASKKKVLCYTGISDFGEAIVVEYDGPDLFFGIAQENGIEKEIKDVAIFGETSYIHSGKISGKIAYIQQDTSLKNENTKYTVGRYISSTELKLTKNP